MKYGLMLFSSAKRDAACNHFLGFFFAFCTQNHALRSTAGREFCGFYEAVKHRGATAHCLQRGIYYGRKFGQQNQHRIAMNTLQMKGNWNVAKGKMKQKFAQLTDNDLQYVEGKEEELIGRIQKRTGQSRQDVEDAIDECCCCGE